MAITIQQGMSQMTAAAQAIIRGAMGRQPGATRAKSSRKSPRRASSVKRSSKRTKRASRASSSGRLKKGSAAAKAWGRKMKKLRAK